MSTTTTTPNADRLDAIKTALLPHVSAMFGANLDKLAAQEAANTANAGFTGLRETTALALASAAHANGWTAADAASGLKLAIDSTNLDKPKSIATFISEMTSAMNPAVREWLPTFAAITTEVETQEALDAKEGGATPVKKAFARRWHVLTALMGQAKDGVYISTTAELRNFAEQRDPDLNAKRQAKAIDDMRATLLTIYGNFQDDDVKEAIDSLSRITAEALTAARIKAQVASGAANDGQTMPAAPALIPAAPPAPVQAPAEGIFDVMQELGVAA